EGKGDSALISPLWIGPTQFGPDEDSRHARPHPCVDSLAPARSALPGLRFQRIPFAATQAAQVSPGEKEQQLCVSGYACRPVNPSAWISARPKEAHQFFEKNSGLWRTVASSSAIWSSGCKLAFADTKNMFSPSKTITQHSMRRAEVVFSEM